MARHGASSSRNPISASVLRFVGILWIVPIAWLVLAALVPTSVLLNGGPVDWARAVTFDAFGAAWSVAPFPRLFLNTVIFAFGLLFVQLVLVTLAGFALARMSFPGKNLIFFIILLQLMVPASVLIFPNYETIVRFGWLNTFQGMMAPYFASAFGIFLMRQAFLQVPRDLEDAARCDGANRLQILWHVFLPVSRPAMAAFSIVSVAYHWNEFLWPLLVTADESTRPLTTGLALLTQMSEAGAQWDQLAAGTLIVIGPIIILLVVIQKQFVHSFATSGMK